MITNQQIQTLFKSNKFYGGEIDGILGNESWTAVKNILAQQNIIFAKNDKSLIMACQILLNNLGHSAGQTDGIWGYNSQQAFNAWFFEHQNGFAEVVKRIKIKGKVYNKEQLKYPLQKDIAKFYGAMGENLVDLILPFQFRLAWDTNKYIKKFSVHSAIKAPLESIFAKVSLEYGEDKIRSLGLDLFGGCFNIRKMRGGIAYSTHSWAIATDFNPENNQLKWKADRALFAKPEYQNWFNIWESHGAVSLGLTADMDWQHTQFARL